MVLVDNSKPLIMDGQYIAKGNVDEIRISLLDQLYRLGLLCRYMPYPQLLIPAVETVHIILLNPVWWKFGELELIDLDGTQTLVRFYQPEFPEEQEITEREPALRHYLSRRVNSLWLFDHLDWREKAIDFLGQELLDHRFACLRETQNRLVCSLGLIPYQLSYFQVQTAPEVGISPIQPVAVQLEGENSRDIPKKHPAKERDTSLNGDNQELLRLWTAGLTAKEIGHRIGKTEKTILNRLSVLRRAYGEERVPRRK
jgi:hypothetical protein